MPGYQFASAPLVSLRSVVKDYRSVAGAFRALKGIDLEVRAGEFVGVIGKSGAGKTTLVNMITGVDSITTGEVCVAGTNVHSLDENRLALWRGLNLGVIFQSFQLMPTLSLLDNVLLPMDFCGLYRGRQSVERAYELLAEVGLEEHIYNLPAAVSGGQQQRVAIARALANDPPVIVADEPTGRLDSLTAEMIFSIFEDLVRQGKTILMVTHDRGLARRMSRVIELVDGEIHETQSAPKVPVSSRSHVERGNGFFDALRRIRHGAPGLDAERPDEGSHAERGNQEQAGVERDA